MTGTDLFVLVPWIAFAVGLAAVGLLLLRSHRASRPRPCGRWRDPSPVCNQEETRCPQKNAKARSR
jgi:hypothetical protein